MNLIPSVKIPAGKSGDCAIDHFEITQKDMLAAWQVYGDRAPNSGKFTRLRVDGVLMMTDTSTEKSDHLEAVRRATGDCLVMGLGLGMVANAMALKPDVKTVTVLEYSKHVIKLVEGSLHKKVTVIQADALEWLPPKGQRWNVVWHDIWPQISLDDCDERSLLKRRFGRRTDWQGAWGDWDINRMKRDDRAWERNMKLIESFVNSGRLLEQLQEKI